VAPLDYVDRLRVSALPLVIALCVVVLDKLANDLAQVTLSPAAPAAQTKKLVSPSTTAHPYPATRCVIGSRQRSAERDSRRPAACTSSTTHREQEACLPPEVPHVSCGCTFLFYLSCFGGV
jgi:hypothetical protein